MRKKLIFGLLSVLMFSFVLRAKDIDESQVPNTVKSYVTKNYPNAVDREWEYKNKNNTFYYYKVEFEIDGREVKLELDTNGNLLYAKEELAISETPDFAKNYINENYSDASIIGLKKKTSNGKTIYDVGILFKNKNGERWHRNVYFDAKGNVIKE